MTPTQVSRTDAIKRFLTAKAPSDLASLYNFDMEVQVNVAAGTGERVEGEFKGKAWVGYTDGSETWKSYRIPRNANTKPEYTDVAQSFNLEKHVEGIGMTGWDWTNKLSRWVAYDFDAITGHSDKHMRKLTEAELKDVRDTISKLEWTTIRTSTSGSGLHVYVFLDPPVPTATHTEHAAVGRSILGLISGLTGVELSAKVDACGQNMWVWHRKMLGTNGLTVLKQGTTLNKVPANWRDHMNVINNKRRKILPEHIDRQQEKSFEELSGQRNTLKLDEEHIKLIEYLNSEENKYFFAYDQDNNMITTHTCAFKEAHEKLSCRGIYGTVSEGNDTEQNCFAYPMRNGGWVVRRFTQHVQEAATWDVDRSGWARCYFNVIPDLKTAASAFGGLEDPKGGYIFRHAEQAIKAASALGTKIDLVDEFKLRQCTLKEHNDGRLIIEVEKSASDATNLTLPDWIDKKTRWSRVLNVQVTQKHETEVGNFDDVIRHIVNIENADEGWVICNNGIWRSEPLQHVQKYLITHGLTPPEISMVIGTAVARCWTIVNRPFQPEYPGDRQWNRDAVQLRFPPSPHSDQLTHPTWDKMLRHVGDSLTPYILDHPWCKENGIVTGGQYLKCWVASAIQFPEEPLPYLFLWSKEQKTGKTTFHEALDVLLTKGVVRADQAISANATHNAELADGIFCVIEEKDLNGKDGKAVYNKVKDLSTSKTILIHKKYMTPYKAANTTHWIHCSNNPDAIRIERGDTRIVSINVGVLQQEQLIPRQELMRQFTKEAPDFLSTILNLEIPTHRDRFFLPVIETADKTEAAESNKTVLESFIDDFCYNVAGAVTKFADFYAALKDNIGDEQATYWNKNRVGRELDKKRFPRGKSVGGDDVCIGNLSLIGGQQPKSTLTQVDGRLIPKND